MFIKGGRNFRDTFTHLNLLKMKKVMMIVAFIATFSGYLEAQNEAYLKAMREAVGVLDTVNGSPGFIAVGNTFGRIASAEPKEWLPLYYNAYCNLRVGFEVANTDGLQAKTYFDVAQKQLDAAKVLAPNEVEIVVLQGYIYQGRIVENPQVNGGEFTQKCYGELGKAMVMSPDNPRPYLIKGQNTYFMPSFWGGGADKAKPILEEALARYGRFKGDSDVYPHWGVDRVKQLLKMIDNG